MTDWKVGDRAQFLGNTTYSADIGTVIAIEKDEVWVNWDSDREDLYFSPDDPQFTKASPVVKSETAEEKAVTLLLSLGYTISKG